MNFIVAAISVTFTLLVYVTFKTKCFGGGCNQEIREGFIVPFFWFGILASAMSSFFLLFPETVFKSWLKKIASWYVPGLLVITATTPVFSSHIMSVDRSQVVFIGMVLLAIITVPFALIARKRTFEQS